MVSIPLSCRAQFPVILSFRFSPPQVGAFFISVQGNGKWTLAVCTAYVDRCARAPTPGGCTSNGVIFPRAQQRRKRDACTHSCPLSNILPFPAPPLDNVNACMLFSFFVYIFLPLSSQAVAQGRWKMYETLAGKSLTLTTERGGMERGIVYCIRGWCSNSQDLGGCLSYRPTTMGGHGHPRTALYPPLLLAAGLGQQVISFSGIERDFMNPIFYFPHHHYHQHHQPTTRMKLISLYAPAVSAPTALTMNDRF